MGISSLGCRTLVAVGFACFAVGCSSESFLEHDGSTSPKTGAATFRTERSPAADERIWGFEQKLVASDGAELDYFGGVAVSGETAVVGASQSSGRRGAVYVFDRSGVRWSEQQKLVASDGAAIHEFGAAIAVEGDTILVGAPGRDGNRGGVYVFGRSGTTWSERQILTASDGQPAWNFASVVALSGETAFVGAQGGVVASNSKQGAVYVFVRSGTTWSERQKLVASDGAAFDFFGGSIGVSGDLAVVGAPEDDDKIGSAYSFVRNGDTWAEEGRLDKGGASGTRYFGFSLWLSGNVLGVGTLPQSSDSYLYRRSGGSWGTPYLISGDSNGVVLGRAPVSDGGTAFVGHASNDGNRGAVYPYELVGGDWIPRPRLVAPDQTPNAEFGSNLWLDGDTLIVGAMGDAMWKGSAYVFRHALGSGSACTLAAECLSGECSEGVCCDEACAAECRSCLARNKASGPDGECGLVRAGTDPRDSCDAEDESTCGRTGTCDGSGACALYPSGTECVVSSCASSMSEDPRDTCDGSGTCEASPERDCAPGYACLSDACRPTCVSDVDCDVAGGYACRGGECKRGENGEPCSEATECESAHCVDGVCCDRPCEDQCEACAEPTDPGNCIAVIGAPRGEREACAEGPAGEPCLDTACDGESRTACAAFAGPSVICASAACVDDQATPAARCDGEGACPATEPVACGAYRCDATACKTSCDSDADCAPGSGCDLNDRCVSGSTCSADGTKAIDSLGNEKSCNPYRCELGQCGESCTASSACATGFACNPSNNQCEKVVEPAAADDGGCGCRASGGSPRRAWLAWLVGAVLVARRRRTRLPPP